MPYFATVNAVLTKRGARSIPNQTGNFDLLTQECLDELGLEAPKVQSIRLNHPRRSEFARFGNRVPLVQPKLNLHKTRMCGAIHSDRPRPGVISIKTS